MAGSLGRWLHCDSAPAPQDLTGNTPQYLAPLNNTQQEMQSQRGLSSMWGKRKVCGRPRRFTDFYRVTEPRTSQDGAGTNGFSQRRTGVVASSKRTALQSEYTVQDSGDRSTSSTFNSLVKQRRKLTADGDTVSDSSSDSASLR